ncbi:gas vesicle protein GvpJ [Anthocerotibacter panamensis]|uniref:gas vesicle protein GvpJ n=1 Tax=Anthocerotibacter panamensis TaxID=2857077 RepID=UPI001C4080F4|nr:gas vesicle protein GvpJ [Anthocerotibacter panamensis]
MTLSTPRPPSATAGNTLADILERVLDKGVVIAGDITVSVGGVELLCVRIRLLISSVDKAREIGINWWESDPHLSGQARGLTQQNEQLLARIQTLEAELERVQNQLAPTLPSPTEE